ncbi:aldehyde dehydrogenase family protein [Alicyclobacillus cycloheptanicus]|uniref:aldehyde dehydrogenase family protein n=1 Tax=Alicyclobacillus cycloheptanicus TaxID=1457 RepID=UPI002378DCD4|nr:aldehyde dehydrogenase family protein [Alicyclobacillus cycloheptanicus]WDM02964.1 aldehyde dehydrogenase family protein [Alicyclobacillus cycloheptanicus]
MTTNVKQDIERVFALQKKHQWTVRRTTAAERKAKLQRLMDVIQAHEDDIVEAVRQDVRKPHKEIKAAEVVGTIRSIQHTLDHLEDWMAPVPVGSSLYPTSENFVMYEPKGVCLILGPWNYPFSLAMIPLAAAVSAGNCAMVKLSDLTPETSRIAANIVREAFDEREVAVFEGEVEVATALLEQPFDHIFFTGSTNVGRIVMTAAAKHLSSVTLELGGKSPTIIDHDFDMAEAAKRIAIGKFMNAGQTCIAPDYVFIRKEDEDAFIGHLKGFADSYLKDGAAVDPEKFTQIVNERNFNRVKGLYDDALDKGAEVVFGGIFDPAERLIAPTVLRHVTPDMKIMQEEIFAPILPVMNYETLDDVITYVNERDKPLALYIFSQNQDVIDRVVNQTTSGNVSVNNVVIHYSDLQLPFGGVNTSGIGSYHGVYGFREFSHEKGVYVQPKK